MPDRIFISIDRPRPIAGQQKIARTPCLVRAQTPVVSKGFEVAEPLGMRTHDAFNLACHEPVQLGTTRQKQILISHFVYERVSEPVDAVLARAAERLDKVGFNQPMEPGLFRVGGAGDGAEQSFLELSADDGGLLQQTPVLRGQPVDSRQEQALQCGWNVVRFKGGCAGPAIALARQHALADQTPKDLLDEQRIAAGAYSYEILKRFPRAAQRGTEQPDDKLTCLVRGQWSQPDDRMLGPLHLWRAHVGPVREQEHERPIRKLIDDPAHQVDRGSVSPVQVFDDDEERLLRKPPLQQDASG